MTKPRVTIESPESLFMGSNAGDTTSYNRVVCYLFILAGFGYNEASNALGMEIMIDARTTAILYVDHETQSFSNIRGY